VGGNGQYAGARRLLERVSDKFDSNPADSRVDTPTARWGGDEKRPTRGKSCREASRERSGHVVGEREKRSPWDPIVQRCSIISVFYFALRLAGQGRAVEGIG
jgi:hypothetical protein